MIILLIMLLMMRMILPTTSFGNAHPDDYDDNAIDTDYHKYDDRDD